MGRDDVYPVKTFKVGLLHYFITRLWNSVVDRPWTSLLDMHHPDPWHAPVAATTVFSTPDAWRGKRPKHVDWTDYILLTNLMHWLLYMFRASSAHLQENTVVQMQHMVLSQFVVASRYTAWAVYRLATTNCDREWQYHMLHVYNCILLKMSTWGSKHVEENSVLW